MNESSNSSNLVVDRTKIKWCPGCGDFMVIAALQKALTKLPIKRENIVIISGIGCSSRLPYYMNSFGFHTLHGRALTIATGLAMSRKDLSIWVITGDGDNLSIGTNHFIHALRRDLNINIIMLNNEIYALTKGQCSPTSKIGDVTLTSPLGNIQKPINPISLAIASGASFVARAFDRDVNHMEEIFKAAFFHKKNTFVEIYQNCIIYNDKTFNNLLNNKILVKNGEKLLSGNKKIVFNKYNYELELMDINNSDQNAVVYNSKNKHLALMLSDIVGITPVGIIFENS